MSAAVSASLEWINQKLRRTLSRRYRAYQEVFIGDFGEYVLADLGKVCKVRRDPYVEGDPHATSYRCGMLAVYKEIQHVLHLTDAEIESIINASTLEDEE